MRTGLGEGAVKHMNHGRRYTYDHHGCRCQKCRKAINDYHRSLRENGPERVLYDAQPLREAMTQAIFKLNRQYVNRGVPIGVSTLARHHAHRFGRPMDTVAREIHRIMSSRTKRIEADTADQWCITLGTHLALLYPELYKSVDA